MPDRLWPDTRFRSAHTLVTRSLGAGSVSGRVEAFGTSAQGSVLAADEGENGWAATLAAKRRFGEHVTVPGEALHVDSNRGARARGGLAARREQNVVQLSLRLHS